MQPPQAQPLHQDSPKSRYNIGLILGGVVAVLGFIGLLQTGKLNLWLILGVVAVGWSWFTNAKQYLIYQDALVVVYGSPRVKVFPFPDIADVDILSMPMGNRLRIRMVSGKRLIVSVRDIDQFHVRLNDALDNFGGNRGGNNIIDQAPEDRTPY